VIPAWTEPTCWAALAMRANGHAVNSRQIVNLYRSATLSSEAIGGHFLSAHRRFWERNLYEPLQADSPIIDVRMEALEGLHPFWLGMNQLKRKLQNTVLVNKWIP
jgi:hypothetical protein